MGAISLALKLVLVICLFGSEILMSHCTWFSGSWGFMTHYLAVDVELSNI